MQNLAVRLLLCCLAAYTMLLTGCATYVPAYYPIPVPNQPPELKPYVEPRSYVHGVPEIERGFSVSLSNQRICLFENWTPVRCGDISSGTSDYPTPSGEFYVLDKDRDKISNQYPEPDGGAWMPNAIRFFEGYYIHEGPLPGLPASHGCIRVNGPDSEVFFRAAEKGMPVSIES